VAGGSAGRRLAQLARLDVGVLEGCGPVRRRALAAVGIQSVLDLLTTYPLRYRDQRRLASVAELGLGEAAWVRARVERARLVPGRGPGRGGSRGDRVELVVADETGRLVVTFFNQRFRLRQLPEGTEALFYGTLRAYRGRRQLTNPQVDLEGRRSGRIAPQYPASERAGIASWEIARLVEEALRRAGPFADPLPQEIRERLGLVDRTRAFWAIHRPENLRSAAAARRRLAFDELLRLQLDVLRRRFWLEARTQGIVHPAAASPGGSALVRDLLARLPFAPTGAQTRAIGEILADLARPRPMHRLLQGDVGAGKTLVAAAALACCVEGGYQAVLLAPTEVLAEQHHRSLQELLGGLEVPDDQALGGRRPLGVGLLTGRLPARQRRQVLADLEEGRLDVVVGTHALLTPAVKVPRLGLVVVDEQHRFGVAQRAELRSRQEQAGRAVPDLLVMTATPIPRTAAMTVLGDLDLTELDELPRGRRPVQTRWLRTPADQGEAWQRVRQEVAAGNRAYVVCPLVAEGGVKEARAAAAERDRLAETDLAGIPLGLLHGQLPAEQKEEALAAFRSGRTPVLVATTVVEVGVDVPEATVMVVEDAGQFGIAQLHQLRGRVGRSERPSWCYLLEATTSPEIRARLEAVEASSDGFVLAEVDLELRGEGTVLGTRQQGRSDLKLASLRRRHRRLVAQARAVAEELLGEDPGLVGHPVLLDEVDALLGGAEAFLGTG
jgi:ATP-dependent DNA helicase RecG